MSRDVPDVPQQHPAALDRQRQETTTKQRERPTAANIHQQHLPKEESKRKARAPTKDTKEQPKKGREGERTRKSKPGKTRSKTRSKRDAHEILALAAANSRKVNRKVESHEGEAYRQNIAHIGALRIDAAQAGRTQQQQAELRSTRQNPAAQGRTQQHKAEPSSSNSSSRRQNLGAAARTQQQQAAAGQQQAAAGSRQHQAAAGRTQQQQAEPSSSTQNPAQARQIPAGTDSNSRGQNHTGPKYDKFQWARLSPNYWQWHHHRDCNQYHIGLSRIMSTIHRPQRWNCIQINNSQSNKEKNYQNLNETLRARRCDTTSGHLVRRKPSGSSSEAIQQQFGSSQRQQLSNSQQLSSSLTVVAKYSWTYRSHW